MIGYLTRCAIIFLSFFLCWSNSWAQEDPNVTYDSGASISNCDCDILVSVNPDPNGTQLGNLDKFGNQVHDVCYYTVEVLITSTGEITNVSNNINDLLTRFGGTNYTEICFAGNFIFEEMIRLSWTNRLVLLDETTFQYLGDGLDEDGNPEPGILIFGNNNSLIGSEDSKIITNTNLSEGLIKVLSQDTPVTFGNSLFTKISDLELVSNGPPVTDPLEDRGIVLENKLESFVNDGGAGDFGGSNYFSNISNVSLSGFGVGINMIGDSNGNNVREISFENIDPEGYGIWMSGCADNSISSLSFTNSMDATAIRMDSYIKPIFDHPSLTNRGVNNPNDRLIFTTNDILGDILANSSNQNAFNLQLNQLDVFMDNVLHSSNCLLSNENQFRDNGLLDRFSLRGYGLDGLPPDYYKDNWVGDGLDVTDVLSDPSNNDCDYILGNPLCIYSKYKYEYESIDQYGNPIDVEDELQATCTETEFISNFYNRPRYNVFSLVNIYDDSGDIQVNRALEIADRMDDGNKRYCSTGGLMQDCIDEIVDCDIGVQNKVYLCPPNNPSTNTNITELVDNRTISGPAPCMEEVSTAEEFRIRGFFFRRDPNNGMFAPTSNTAFYITYH